MSDSKCSKPLWMQHHVQYPFGEVIAARVIGMLNVVYVQAYVKAY